MDYVKKYRIVLWAALILMVFNVAAIGTFLVQRAKDNRVEKLMRQHAMHMPGMGMGSGMGMGMGMGMRMQNGRIFRDQLGLDQDQFLQFRNFRRDFNQQGLALRDSMRMIRDQWLGELSKENTDDRRLNELAGEIGHLHMRLKLLTAKYYLNMKGVCNPEQQKKLHVLFSNMQDIQMEPVGRAEKK